MFSDIGRCLEEERENHKLLLCWTAMPAALCHLAAAEVPVVFHSVQM